MTLSSSRSYLGRQQRATSPQLAVSTSQRQRLRTVRILGTGSYVPETVLSNGDLERLVETDDTWIQTRTGMRERRILEEGRATSDLAVAAAERALESAAIGPEDLDLVLVATCTPDHPVSPATACIVQHRIGAVNATAFDISAACSGFVTALMTAHGMVAGGGFRRALVIGADALSRVTDYEDRETCILFGDGAGAVVIGEGAGRSEILDHVSGCDGSGWDMIQVPAGGSRKPASVQTAAAREQFLTLRGREVFRFAVAKICELVPEILARNGRTLEELSLLVPHQANQRILEAAAKKLGLPMDRVASHVAKYGNTSTASIPLALDEAARAGEIAPGSLVCLVAFGGGLTWAATLLEW